MRDLNSHFMVSKTTLSAVGVIRHIILLVTLTGYDPAHTDLKDQRLYQFAYSAIIVEWLQTIREIWFHFKWSNPNLRHILLCLLWRYRDWTYISFRFGKCNTYTTLQTWKTERESNPTFSGLQPLHLIIESVYIYFTPGYKTVLLNRTSPSFDFWLWWGWGISKSPTYWLKASYSASELHPHIN